MLPSHTHRPRGEPVDDSKKKKNVLLSNLNKLLGNLTVLLSNLIKLLNNLNVFLNKLKDTW